MNKTEDKLIAWWENTNEEYILTASEQNIINNHFYSLNALHSELIANLKMFIEKNPTEEALEKITKKVWKLYFGDTPFPQKETEKTLRTFISEHNILTIAIINEGISFRTTSTPNSQAKHTFITFKDLEKKKIDFQVLDISKKLKNLNTSIRTEIQICYDKILPLKCFENQTKTTHGLTLNDIQVLWTRGETQSRKTIFKRGNTLYSIPLSYFISNKTGEKEKRLKLTSSHLHFLLHLLGNIKPQEKQLMDLETFMKIMEVKTENKKAIYNKVHRLKQMFLDLTQIKVTYDSSEKNSPHYEQRAIFQNTFSISKNKIEYYLETKFVEDIKKFPTNFVLPLGIMKIPLIEKVATRIYLKLFSHYVQNYKKNNIEGTLSVKSLGFSCGFDFSTHLNQDISQILNSLKQLEEYGVLKLIGFKDTNKFYENINEISNLTNREKSELMIIYVPQDLSIIREQKELQ